MATPTPPPDHPIPLSAVIIATAIDASIVRTLQSLTGIDDIVVVVSPTAIVDEALVQQFHIRAVRHPWMGFGAQKNYALTLAQNDWVLSLDSDEVPSAELLHELQQLMQSPQWSQNPYHAYRIRRINHFLGKPLGYGEGGNDWLPRFFHRQFGRYSDRSVHERLIIEGPLGQCQGILDHYSAENLIDYVRKQCRYSALAAVELRQHYRGAPPQSKMLINPLIRWIKFGVWHQGFRDGWAGFAHISVGAMATFLKYLFAQQAIHHDER